MIMLVDLSHCNVGHEELHRRTDALAAEMKMQINVTRQEVFDACTPSDRAKEYKHCYEYV